MPIRKNKESTEGASKTASLEDSFDQSIYDEFYRIANKLMATEEVGHTLQATALVNEAWIRMNGAATLEANDRQHLIAIATRQMRRALVDHARKKKATKRPNHHLRVSLNTREALFTTSSDKTLDLIDLCVALEELEQQNLRHSQVFEMRFFGGQTIAECSEYLNVSTRTIKYDWQFATAWIAQRLGLKPS